MKIYQKYDVYEAALARINYLFDEFSNRAVSISGGKDSTVILNLALQVAEQRGELPLKVVFLDQEAEWQMVIDYLREQKKDPRIEMYWYQMPIRLSNATSHDENWLQCWEDGKEWMRPKEPDSIHVNDFGTPSFIDLFPKILDRLFNGQKACFLTGVRAEESPIRRIGLCVAPTYKHITYGKILNKGAQQFNFHPLYDWSYSDIWYAIEHFKWPYCRIYDFMYQSGQNSRDMRVSNLHHETAVWQLLFLQEIEPATWKALTKRLGGINMTRHMDKESQRLPKVLPEAFDSWKEMRDYLTETLVSKEEQRIIFRKKFKEMDRLYAEIKSIETMHKAQTRAVIINDYHLVTVQNWERGPDVAEWRRWKYKGKPIKNTSNKYIYG